MRSLEFLGPDTVASGGLDQRVQFWTISSGQTISYEIKNSGVYSLIRIGGYLAVGLGNGDINIIHAVTDPNVVVDQRYRNLVGHGSGQINDLIVITNSNLLASSGADQTVRIWDLTYDTVKFVLQGVHTSAIVGLRQISSDILACAGSTDRKITLWNITSGQYIRTLTGHSGFIYWSLDLLSDGQTLVSGSGDQTIRFWDVTSGQNFNTLNTGSTINALTLLDRPSSISSVLFLKQKLFFYFPNNCLRLKKKASNFCAIPNWINGGRCSYTAYGELKCECPCLFRGPTCQICKLKTFFFEKKVKF